jgi:hypothetical protein
VKRALAARARIDRLLSGRETGPLLDQLSSARLQMSEALDQVWALSKTSAEVFAQAARADEVGRQLAQVQAGLRPGAGSGDGATTAQWLSEREAALAAELRELRRTQGVAARLAGGVSAIVIQMESLVTTAAELLASGSPPPELSELTIRLQTLAGAMEDARQTGAAQANTTPTSG